MLTYSLYGYISNLITLGIENNKYASVLTSKYNQPALIDFPQYFVIYR